MSGRGVARLRPGKGILTLSIEDALVQVLERTWHWRHLWRHFVYFIGRFGYKRLSVC
jgi:hypothetical protein